MPEIPVWYTQRGQGIPINRMTDSHLTNTINYLESMLSQMPPANPNVWEPARESVVEWIAKLRAERTRRYEHKFAITEEGDCYNR